eukprot:Rmarinus@m.26360
MKGVGRRNSTRRRGPSNLGVAGRASGQWQSSRREKSFWCSLQRLSFVTWMLRQSFLCRRPWAIDCQWSKSSSSEIFLLWLALASWLPGIGNFLGYSLLPTTARPTYPVRLFPCPSRTVSVRTRCG